MSGGVTTLVEIAPYAGENPCRTFFTCIPSLTPESKPSWPLLGNVPPRPRLNLGRWSRGP